MNAAAARAPMSGRERVRALRSPVARLQALLHPWRVLPSCPRNTPLLSAIVY